MIVTFAVTLLLVSGRISGMWSMMPVLSAQGVPRRVITILPMVIALTIAPAVPLVKNADSLSVIFLGMAGEIAFGMMLGLTVKAVFSTAAMAADLASQQMGMGMASVTDPFMKHQTTGLGSLASWLAGLVFLGLGLHHRIFEVIAWTFYQVPPGSIGLPIGAAPQFAEAVSTSVELGVQLAGPILAMAWLINLFMALLSKVAPKMNAFFAFSHSITTPAAIFMFSASLPWFLLTHSERVTQAILSWRDLAFAVR